MAASRPENHDKGAEHGGIVATAREFVAALPKTPACDAAAHEGTEIAAIVGALGLPDDVVAAVHLYPLIRDGCIDEKHSKNNLLNELSRITGALVRLGRFSLPPDWQPGEALAVQQSEALRKMLLAVVSDVRLVLVRIAEQLFRMRSAKNSPAASRASLATETREINGTSARLSSNRSRESSVRNSRPRASMPR
jgi:(p)ppGpp synthase/HD superfamily hydrolase